MPPRKKTNGATAGSPPVAVRRSTRASKGQARKSNNSSSDELSSSIIAHDGRDKESIEAEASPNEEVVDEITVCTTRTTRSKSYASSRPSTANSDSASQSRVISTPVTKRDINMLHDGANEAEDELAGEGPTLKKPKTTFKLVSKSTRKGRSKYDNPDEMLTNPRAPLATVNLRDLLCSSKAWDVLSSDEKKQVLAKFPDDTDILDASTDDARPNIAALKNNNNFRHDIVRYQENLRKGWHDPEWIRQAQAAHRQREIGVYNEYLSARFEEDWSMALPGEEDQGEQEYEEHPEKNTSEQGSDSHSDHENHGTSAMSGLKTNGQNGEKAHQETKVPEQEGDTQKNGGIPDQSAISGQAESTKEDEEDRSEVEMPEQKGNGLKEEEIQDPNVAQEPDPLAQETEEDGPKEKVPEQQVDLRGREEDKVVDSTQGLENDVQETRMEGMNQKVLVTEDDIKKDT